MKITPEINNKAAQIVAALKTAGFKPVIVPILLGQIANETAYKGVPFNSPVSQKNTNYSGITWINKPTQKNAVKGSQLNIKETKGKPVYYAKFNSLQDWANDYFRILSGGKNSPLSTTDTAIFVNRLKERGYFTDDTTTYLKNVNYWLDKFKNIELPKPNIILPVLLLIGAFFLFKK
jgi:hypothetical protein